MPQEEVQAPCHAACLPLPPLTAKGFSPTLAEVLQLAPCHAACLLLLLLTAKGFLLTLHRERFIAVGANAMPTSKVVYTLHTVACKVHASTDCCTDLRRRLPLPACAALLLPVHISQLYHPSSMLLPADCGPLFFPSKWCTATNKPCTGGLAFSTRLPAQSPAFDGFDTAQQVDACILPSARRMRTQHCVRDHWGHVLLQQLKMQFLALLCGKGSN